DQVKHDTISVLSRIRIQSEQDVLRMEAQRRMAQALQARHAEAAALGQLAAAAQAAGAGGAPLPAGAPAAGPAEAAAPHTPFVRTERKVGRNEPCPCGSGRKYKQCHGRLT